MAWRLPWYKDDSEMKSVVLGTSESLGSFLIFGDTGNASTPASALALYEKSSAVAIPINMITDAFSVLDPILLIDEKKVPEHDILELLKKPSPHFDQELFLETLAKDYLITGENCVIAIGRINKPPLQLQPISPRNVTVVPAVNGTVHTFMIAGITLNGSYIANLSAKNVNYYDGNLRELKLTRNFSTLNNSLLRGQSKLVSASKEARQHILGTEHNVSLLEKGGRVSLVFNFDADMNDRDFEAAKKRVREQYGGVAQAGEIGVTAGGKLAIHELGTTGKDMDYSNLHKVAKESCALTFRVPLPLITAERQTMNNYKEAKIALYDDAVGPLSKAIFGGLKFIFPRYGLDPSRARLSFDPDQVTALVSRRNDEILKRSKLGIESDNELRSLIGREGYEGGGVIYKGSNMIPVGTDLDTSDEDINIIETEDDI